MTYQELLKELNDRIKVAERGTLEALQKLLTEVNEAKNDFEINLEDASPDIAPKPQPQPVEPTPEPTVEKAPEVDPSFEAPAVNPVLELEPLPTTVKNEIDDEALIQSGQLSEVEAEARANLENLNKNNFMGRPKLGTVTRPMGADFSTLSGEGAAGMINESTNRANDKMRHNTEARSVESFRKRMLDIVTDAPSKDTKKSILPEPFSTKLTRGK